MDKQRPVGAGNRGIAGVFQTGTHFHNGGTGLKGGNFIKMLFAGG